MKIPVRLLVDVGCRALVVLVLTEGAAASYSSQIPDDDGLGAGLTAMSVLVCAAALWGIWDGFHRAPVQLCTTWVATGILVSLGSTLESHLRHGEWSWSALAGERSGDLLFWTGLVAVPAIVCGIGRRLAGNAGILPIVHGGRAHDGPTTCGSWRPARSATAGAAEPARAPGPTRVTRLPRRVDVTAPPPLVSTCHHALSHRRTT